MPLPLVESVWLGRTIAEEDADNLVLLVVGGVEQAGCFGWIIQTLQLRILVINVTNSQKSGSAIWRRQFSIQV